MATKKLIPSAYAVSNTSYISVSDASNMYHDVSNTTYATFYNSRASTTTYYGYIKGFNFDDIPEEAVVSSIKIRIKGRESGAVTSAGTSYAICVTNGTTAISGTYATAQFNTSEQTIEVPWTASWNALKQYGDDLGIRVCVRRSSRNTAAYVYVYGAEIEVEYTVPDPAVVTSTLEGNGTIDPSGATNTYEGSEYTLTITPTDNTEEVHVTNNGVDVTSELVAHGRGGEATIVPESATTSGVQSGTSYAQYAVGHSAENPSSSGTSSNMYASSSSTGYAEYSFDFSGIPSNATIESIEVRCYGHRESSTVSSTYVSKCGIYSNGSLISAETEFPSTSNSIITLEPNSLPSRSELDNVTIRHTVGYYGGLVLGISFDVTYSTGEGVDHYTYTYTVSGDATIAVVIGSQGDMALWDKESGVWQKYTKAWKKVNGTWVQQSDLSTVFNNSTNYIKGN